MIEAIAGPLIELTIDATLWMLEYWYISWVILFIEYAILMKGFSKTQGSRYETLYKYSAGIFFLPQDWVVNWTICTLVFLDIPDTPLEVVTSRMKRYKGNGGVSRKGFNFNWDWLTEWRWNFAHWLCRHLNKYDPEHC